MTTPVVPIYPAAGAAVPVHAVTGPSIGGPAIPVYVVSDGRPTLGQPPRRVKLITDADLTINGGNYWIEGRPFAMPVAVSTATSGDEGNVPIPVYAVNAWPGASTPAFAPTDIAGLALWLKADAGLFKDAAKTQPATADGDLVYTWADQSGNGRDLVQATAGLRPQLKLNIQNTKPALLNSLTGSQMSVTLPASAAWTFIVVANSISELNVSPRLWSFGSNNAILNLYSQGPNWGFYDPVVDLGVTSRTMAIVTIKLTSNAVANWAINNGAWSANFNPHDFGTETLFKLFYSGAGEWWNGYVCEFLAYNSAISDANFTLIKNYLNVNTRWAVY